MRESTAIVSAGALVALALTSPAAAQLISFEKNWDYGTEINGYYSAGTASDGTSGPNYGVTFTNFLGVSNDAFFTYFLNAPSPQGTAYAQLDGVVNTTAYMNVPAGVTNSLFFYYSSPTTVVGAVRVFSGENGTGALLGTFDLLANDPGTSPLTETGAYTVWTPASLAFAGTARSFDFTGSANVVAFDNITIPAPGAATVLAGAMLFAARRRRV